MAGTEENNIAVFRLSGLSRFLHPFIFLSVLASCLTSGIQTLELFGTFWTLQRPGCSSSAFLLEPFLDFSEYLLYLDQALYRIPSLFCFSIYQYLQILLRLRCLPPQCLPRPTRNFHPT